MFNFIICDDEIMFSKNIVKVIDSIFMKNDLEYTTSVYNGYNSSLEKEIKEKNNNKIYILDIEMKNGISGIDIARKIREYDWSSIIIMLTSHGEMGYEVLKAQIMVLDFISKFDNYKERLEQVIYKLLEQNNMSNYLSYKIKGTSYRIDMNQILYIVKEPLNNKCKIVTSSDSYNINSSLNNIIEKLNDKFYVTHRSCVVNTEKIKTVDWKNGIIIFKNNTKIDLLSRERKKGLKNYVNV